MDDPTPYFQGLLTSTVLLAIEHLTLYATLKPRGDSGDTVRVLIKFFLGVFAILAGCAVIAWQTNEPIAILAPVAASCSGLVIVACYGWRWLWNRARDTAYMRGRLHGLVDKGDVQEGRDG